MSKPKVSDRILIAVLVVLVIVLCVVTAYQQVILMDIIRYMEGHSEVHNNISGGK